MKSQHPTQARLLLVEDDDELAALMLEYLGRHAFELDRVASGDEAVEAIIETRPHLVILDLMLPGMSGLDVCSQIRDRYSGALLMLTASQSEADHVAALELGADDFVTKPIEPRILLARIHTQLRRLEIDSAPFNDDHPGTLHLGGLQLNLVERRVQVDEEPVSLTEMEFDILAMLAKQAGAVVQRDDLYRHVLGTEYDGLDRGLDVHVSRIRRKLQRAHFDTSRLRSVRAVGYLLTSQ